MTNVYVLTASGKLDPFVGRIKEKAKESIKRIAIKIPLPNVDIVFSDNQSSTIPHLGIGGFTPNEHLVFVYLNPNFSNFENTINEEIFRTLAHELHHCLRWQNPGYGYTLLEAMASEGLADHFDVEVTGKGPQKWDVALSTKQVTNLNKKAQLDYNNKHYNHNAWFFGSKEEKTPKWTGYTLGFKLINDYLKRNPNKKASQLYSVRAEEILN